MTDQKPNPCNCSTCIKKKDYSCKFGIADVTQEFTKVTGCFDHPDARAYLMRDVIEELEKQKAWCREKSLTDRSGNCKAFMWTAGGYERAIRLISGDGK